VTQALFCRAPLNSGECDLPNFSFLQAHVGKVWNGEYYAFHTPAVQRVRIDDTNDADLEHRTAHPVSEVNCAILPFSLLYLISTIL